MVIYELFKNRKILIEYDRDPSLGSEAWTISQKKTAVPVFGTAVPERDAVSLIDEESI
jgi:hypothetical protein